MAEYRAVKVDGLIWGMLPCGEIKIFLTEKDYAQAYRNEENEIADEMARLEEERAIYSSYNPTEYLRYA